MPDLKGLALDWTEKIAGAMDDLEARPAGSTESHHYQSDQVDVSRDNGFYVYHVADNELGQGSSLGNARVWAETKGNNDMLNFFSTEVGTQVFGGFSVTYLLPFTELSTYGRNLPDHEPLQKRRYSRPMAGQPGSIHLHPAFQQRSFVLGDGLHVLETFFVPRTGEDDPAVAHTAVFLENRTRHPLSITIVGSVNLRGQTPWDVQGSYDRGAGAILAWNASHPDWVRCFGASHKPAHHLITTDEETAFSPGSDFDDTTDGRGDPTGSLQFTVFLLPGQSHKLRFTMAFSPEGPEAALQLFRHARGHDLSDTIAHYKKILDISVLEMPDALLTHAVQWAKACMLRPVMRFPVGECFVNDPGWTTHLVGRDTAWFVHGCDFVLPDVSCSMLNVFAAKQRADGLIAEYIDGLNGESVDHSFNINDNTPLFIMAVAHHLKATGHTKCLSRLYEACRKAGELILSQRDERGLVKCANQGMGVDAICGWRNVLANEQITGVVTEINSECYAALKALAHLAQISHDSEAASRYEQEAEKLRDAMNTHLIDRHTGLYIRNIDLDGNVFTQATVDLVFPLICGVAGPETVKLISERLIEPDFMTDAGIRALPSANPRYDPSSQSGCLGGIWPGATWWYAMGCAGTHQRVMADSLRRSYWHYVSDPKTFNTVPGQFSEWADGQTLVNRGMRLSPWEAPRYLWVAIEGLAGVKMGPENLTLDPQLPPDWRWLRMHNLLYRGQQISFFLARQSDGIHVYSTFDFVTELPLHKYDTQMTNAAETLTIGLSETAFGRPGEVMICLGNTQPHPIVGPFLTHHSLSASKSYLVLRLQEWDDDWNEVGVLEGEELQRIAVRVDGETFALYRFLEQD